MNSLKIAVVLRRELTTKGLQVCRIFKADYQVRVPALSCNTSDGFGGAPDGGSSMSNSAKGARMATTEGPASVPALPMSSSSARGHSQGTSAHRTIAMSLCDLQVIDGFGSGVFAGAVLKNRMEGGVWERA